MARRLVALFLVCAMLPVTALAVVTWSDVTTELSEQARDALHTSAKHLGMHWLDRLRQLAERTTSAEAAAGGRSRGARRRHSEQRLDPLVSGSKTISPAAFSAEGFGGLTVGQREHLQSGRVLLLTRPSGDTPSVALVWLGESAHGAERPLRIVDLHFDVMFRQSTEETLLPYQQAWLLDDKGRVVAHARAEGNPDDDTAFDDPRSFTVRFSLPLSYDFAAGNWDFVVAMPRELALSASEGVGRRLGLVGTFSIGLVLLLSLVQVRRTMAPLAQLKQSAERLAHGDFSSPVCVTSTDEFKGLAEAFDQMRVELQEQFARLDRLQLGTITALARAIDAKSAWTAGHSERVTRIGVALGQRLGVSGRELEALRIGGWLHDIGKIGVPAAVLDKAGHLSPDEEAVMRQHCELGARILAPIPEYADVLPIVLEHHERYDGTGYPHGKRGEEISLGARIFAVADVFDALSSSRPYRRGLPPDQVLAIMRNGRGTHFDPVVLDEFFKGLEEPGFPDAAPIGLAKAS